MVWGKIDWERWQPPSILAKSPHFPPSALYLYKEESPFAKQLLICLLGRTYNTNLVLTVLYCCRLN